MYIKISLSLTLILVSVEASGAVIESFEQSGGDASLSSFSTIYTSGGGTFLRETLNGIPGAPNSVTSLPVNTGGDKELRYLENLNINIAATAGYALTNNTYSNATIDAYIGINGIVGPAYAKGGVMLNVSGSSISTLNGYQANITVRSSDTSQATLGFTRYESGIGTGISYRTFQPFDVDIENENYRLSFDVDGGVLTASLWRVLAVNGSLIEQEIDLQTTNGIQNTVSVTDSSFIINPDSSGRHDPNNPYFIPDPDYEIFSSGKIGLSAFARNGSEVYFDDITIAAVPIPASFLLFLSGLIGLVASSRNASNK
ncbi:MAG TPA: hypothetical protein EYO59_03190 [Chromatiaceae bacterium]|nr:hypothetical protein [Chromatiaceae bacterium]